MLKRLSMVVVLLALAGLSAAACGNASVDSAEADSGGQSKKGVGEPCSCRSAVSSLGGSCPETELECDGLAGLVCVYPSGSDGKGTCQSMGRADGGTVPGARDGEVDGTLPNARDGETVDGTVGARDGEADAAPDPLGPPSLTRCGAVTVGTLVPMKARYVIKNASPDLSAKTRNWSGSSTTQWDNSFSGIVGSSANGPCVASISAAHTTRIVNIPFRARRGAALADNTFNFLFMEAGAGCDLPGDRRIWKSDGNGGTLTFTRVNGPTFRAEIRDLTLFPEGLGGGVPTGAGTGTFTLDADLMVDCTP